MLVGGYCLHLYCDLEDEPHEWKTEFIEIGGEYQTRSQAIAAAKKKGWDVWKHNGQWNVRCPAHARKKR